MIFTKSKERYFAKNTIHSIYEEQEDSIGYVLYQSWSMDWNNKNEISSIQNASKKIRTIYDLAFWWKGIKYDKNWKSFQNMKESDIFWSDNFEYRKICFPIEDLVKLTLAHPDLNNYPEIKEKAEFWKMIIENDKNFIEWSLKEPIRQDKTLV